MRWVTFPFKLTCHGQPALHSGKTEGKYFNLNVQKQNSWSIWISSLSKRSLAECQAELCSLRGVRCAAANSAHSLPLTANDKMTKLTRPQIKYLDCSAKRKSSALSGGKMRAECRSRKLFCQFLLSTAGQTVKMQVRYAKHGLVTFIIETERH